MEKLFLLLDLQRRAQEAPTRQAFAHVAVNDTHKLISYKQAIFWRMQGGAPILDKVSGTAVLEEKGPYALAVRDLIRDRLPGPEAGVVTVYPPQGDHDHVMLAVFRTAEDGILGGMWLENDQAFPEADQHIMAELAASYAHALALVTLRGQKNYLAVLKGGSRYRRHIVAACIILALWPTRLTVTAPAEIVARDAQAVTVPYDGIVEKIHVEPGEAVRKGQLLATMEHSALMAQADLARQELRATEASVARLSRESLATPEKKGDLTAVMAEIENKRLQAAYAADMAERSEIRAGRDGIAVFSDAVSLQGKPAMTGDKIMMVADSLNYDVLIRVPVDAMVPLRDDNDVSFYLNVSPLKAYDARIKSIGYQASPDSDGLLTYKIRAVPDDADALRIGWKGTARIHGGWTVLSYEVLRRPLSALRKITGL